MSKYAENIEILLPQNQLHLFGYKKYFNSFIQLFEKNKLPNTIMLSGLKGSGKATFAYHFINFLLSHNEKDKYSVTNFAINPNNKSYKFLCNGSHPNFFLLQNSFSEESIKIDKVKELLAFLSKSTYNSNIKIVLIDNAEYLNVHSSNALLKVLEEPHENTFFFIIHNSANKILNTIKSRCIEFKYFFTLLEKKNILENIIKQYDSNFNVSEIDEYFYFDTAGNILNYIKILNDENTPSLKDRISCISYLIGKYEKKNDPQLLLFISSIIELFYNELSFKNSENLNIYFHNKYKILTKINDLKKYNLDKKNLFISLKSIIENES